MVRYHDNGNDTFNDTASNLENNVDFPAILESKLFYKIYVLYMFRLLILGNLCYLSRDHNDDEEEEVDEGVVSEEASALPTDGEEIKEEKDVNEPEEVDELAEYGLDRYDEEDIGT